VTDERDLRARADRHAGARALLDDAGELVRRAVGHPRLGLGRAQALGRVGEVFGEHTA
jgi:hypothetical protein